MGNLSHWSTVEKLIKPENVPQWVQGEDQTRIAAYEMYEAIYWTAPKSFQIMLRGQEGDPILIPSGRRVVDTAHRYLSPDFSVIADPLFGSDQQREEAMLVMTDFSRRERFFSKFSANKLKGLMRGDWLWHVFADPERQEGARVSIFPIDPGLYFPEYRDVDQIQDIVAVHLVEPTVDSSGDPAVRKLVYRKVSETGGPSTIAMMDVLCPVDEWGQPGTDMTETILDTFAEEELPSPIDQIPVYHIPNAFEPEFGMGSSEMRGIEILLKSINQAITDEDLTLVLEGLGVYVTDAGSPVDNEGNALPWNLGPARVVELPTGKTFNRVSGAGSIAPYQDHLKYLHEQVDETTGSNDITRGRAEVQVAESGIALMLRMGPILTRMTEKELIVTDVTTNMLFDLRRWFQAYEDLNLEEIRWLPRYGEKIPVNKAQLFDQVMKMYASQPPLVSGQEARRMLTKVGFEFTEGTDLFSEILQETGDYHMILADATAMRIQEDINSIENEEEGGGN